MNIKIDLSSILILILIFIIVCAFISIYQTNIILFAVSFIAGIFVLIKYNSLDESSDKSTDKSADKSTECFESPAEDIENEENLKVCQTGNPPGCCPVEGVIMSDYKIDSPPNKPDGDCEYTEGYNEHTYAGFSEGFAVEGKPTENFHATKCGQTYDQTTEYDPLCCTSDLDHYNRQLGQVIDREDYNTCYPPIAKELSNVREYQRVAEPMNMIPFNGRGVPVDEKNTMMALARSRDKKIMDGFVSKTAEYYKQYFGDELAQSEAKVWWGANEY